MAEVTRWEYHVLTSGELKHDWLGDTSRETVLRALNDLGGQGWELVNIDWADASQAGFSAVFKRPVR